MKVIGIESERRVKWTNTNQFKTGDLLTDPGGSSAHFMVTDVSPQNKGWAVCCKPSGQWGLGRTLRGDCCNYVRIIDGDPEYEDVMQDGVEEVRMDNLSAGDIFRFKNNTTSDFAVMDDCRGYTYFHAGIHIESHAVGYKGQCQLCLRYHNATLVLGGCEEKGGE